MKRFILAIALITCFTATSYSQDVRLNGYAGYVFDDSFDSYYSSNSYLRGKIEGGFQWGLGVEFLVQPEYGIEILYFRQDTKAPVNYWDDMDQQRTIDLGLNYIMLGGVRYLPINDMIEGYGGLMAGVAIYDNKYPQSGEPNSNTMFAWGARLGMNIWLADRFGIKLQTQLMSAVQGFGGGFYFGTGGAGAGVSTYSTLWQFGLGGGIVIKVGS